jgi:hypothetical protein
VEARNGLANFWRSPPVATVSYENIHISNCSVDFHPTLHGSTAGGTYNAAPIFLSRSNDSYVKQFTFANATFRNINSASAASEAAWVIIGLPGTTPCTDITLRDLTFHGASGAFHNQNPGIFVYGNVQRLTIDNCRLYGPEDRGIYISPQSGTTVSDVTISNCLVSASQSDSYAVFPNGTGTAKRIYIRDCIAIDGALSSGRHFLIGTSAATDSTTFVHVDGCRSVKTSGGVTGLELFHTGGSTLSNIWLGLNDMSQTGGTNYAITGTPSGIHYDPPRGIGTSITAAATIAIPTDGTVFHVTGNTNVTNGITVSPIDNGRQITLVFDGTPTVSDTGTSKLNGNMVCTADDTLTLVCDAGNWFEVARSAN